MGGSLDEAPTIHTVRDVSPNKLMLCVTFRVPKGVAFAGRGAGREDQGDAATVSPDAKRMKLDS